MKDFTEIRKKRIEEETKNNIDNIYNAKSITEEEYNEKKNKNNIIESELYEIYKFNLQKLYQINEIDKNFIEDYYEKNKMKWYKNLSSILECKNELDQSIQKSEDKLEYLRNIKVINDIDCYSSFSKSNKYINHYYALNIIDKMDFNINDLSIKKYNDDIIKNVDKTIIWINENKKYISNTYNLDLYNKHIKNLNFKIKLKYINDIINNQYGLKIKKNNSKNEDNIFYKLCDNKLWDKLSLYRNNNEIKINIIPKYYNILKYNENINNNQNIDLFI